MEVLFSDFVIEALIPDRSCPGVLFKGRKPSKFQERDLSAYPLYSMMTDGRAVTIHNRDILIFRARHLAQRAVIPVLPARSLLPGPIKRGLKRLLGF
jgi:hypothetical protein